MRPSLSLFSTFLFLMVARWAAGQVFDEKFDHWPQNLKIGGTVVIHNQLSDSGIWQRATLDFMSTKPTGKKDQEIQATIITNALDRAKTALQDVENSRLKPHSFIQLETLDLNKLRNSLKDTPLAVLHFLPEKAIDPAAIARAAPVLKEFVAKKGTIVANSEAARWLSKWVIQGTDQSPRFVTGLNLVPDSIIETRFSEPGFERRVFAALAIYPRSVGIGIQNNTCLVFKGRKLFTFETGEIKMMLAANDRSPRRTQLIGAKRKPQDRYDFEYNLVDLTQWRRDAIDRTLPTFPPTRPPEPCIDNGTLVIVGGGGMPKNLMNEFVEMAGGEQAYMVYVPCAESESVAQKQRTVEAWKRMGVKSASFIHTKDRHKANTDPTILNPLKKATGIWFGGGRQWNFSDSYYGTEAHRLMKEVLKRGGVIGGSSAGASIQARYLARATPIANFKIMAFGYERGGLGFIPGVAIDQHFSQRGRQKDMTQLMNTHPQLLGIGLDEATAIIVNKSQAKVVGKGKVHFYDRRKPVYPGKPDFIALPEGSVYDLKDRKIIVKSIIDGQPPAGAGSNTEQASQK